MIEKSKQNLYPETFFDFVVFCFCFKPKWTELAGQVWLNWSPDSLNSHEKEGKMYEMLREQKVIVFELHSDWQSESIHTVSWVGDEG